MFTRSDYIRGEVSHEDYYHQLITDEMVTVVAARMGLAALWASVDHSYFSDLPLRSWEAAGERLRSEVDHSRLAAMGQAWDAVIGACVARAAARVIVAGIELPGLDHIDPATESC